MKGIKFRIWDKVANKWLDDEDIYFNQEGEAYLIEERTWAYQSYMHKEYITEKVEIVRFTGLEDKNGKEIYEGDILECTSELLTNFGKTKTGRYETTYKQVIWLTDSWGYRVLKSKHIVEGAKRKGLEVAIKFGVICGNIYENPELLEESK
ncbi:putative phage protein (TIGR01671 family) [Bacillus thuringiensis]|uniref:Putative phage protein (TIGR01671 family) n=1 Tax=Bacillus thuringiensis TaxID=1428 RepID=A0A4R4BMT1_BACTU|nr:YopX family protein [Bacillus thuringiensis]TCW58984.1 putative phage protein (TIGR01671 family) [Bacillus thuringiensis]TCW59776.1 putative phage protein (TIGR01671 family) [Bacillus thuringiensis]